MRKPTTIEAVDRMANTLEARLDALEARLAGQAAPDERHFRALQEATAQQGQHLNTIDATLNQFIEVTNRLIKLCQTGEQNVAKIAQILTALKTQLDNIDNDVQDLLDKAAKPPPPPPPPTQYPVGPGNPNDLGLGSQKPTYRPVSLGSIRPAPVSPAVVAQPPAAPRQQVPKFKPDVTLANPDAFGDAMAFGDNH